jgi:uncharacterized protein YlxW (UPF0749 family)
MTNSGMFEEMGCIKELKKQKKENKKLTDSIEELKADLARAKEDHQYDNLVHQNELKSLRKK